MAAMTWKKWRIGFFIAILFGLLNAGAGLLGDMGWKSFVAVLCASLLTNLSSYLMKHPVESVSDEPPIRPPGTWLFMLGVLCLGLMGCTIEKNSKGWALRPPVPPPESIVSMEVSHVGIQVGQNQATQTPEFNIGYKRWSYRRVPTSDSGKVNAPPVRAEMNVRKVGFDAGITEVFEVGE